MHWYQKKTVSGSGISWAICKCAPRSRQTTTPAPHHSSTEQNSNIPVSVISTLLQFHSCQLCIAALKLQTNGREISPLITNTASTQCCWKKWSIVTLQWNVVKSRFYPRRSPRFALIYCATHTVSGFFPNSRSSFLCTAFCVNSQQRNHNFIVRCISEHVTGIFHINKTWKRILVLCFSADPFPAGNYTGKTMLWQTFTESTTHGPLFAAQSRKTQSNGRGSDIPVSITFIMPVYHSCLIAVLKLQSNSKEISPLTTNIVI